MDSEFRKIAVDDTPVRFFMLGSAPCGTAPLLDEDSGTDINFTRYWVPNPRDSYTVMATGDSMEDARIFPGDMLVIDAGMEVRNGHIVVAWLNGELTVKRLRQAGLNTTILVPENSKYSPITITESDDFRILGVVTSVHRRL